MERIPSPLSLEGLPTELRLMIFKYLFKAEAPSRNIVRQSKHACACSAEQEATPDESHSVASVDGGLLRLMLRALCVFRWPSFPKPPQSTPEITHTSSRRQNLTLNIFLVNHSFFWESRDVFYSVNTLTLTSEETFTLLDQPEVAALIKNLRILEHRPDESLLPKSTITSNFRRVKQLLSSPRLKTVEIDIEPILIAHAGDDDDDGDDGDDDDSPSPSPSPSLHRTSIQIAISQLGLEHSATVSCDDIGLYTLCPALRGHETVPGNQLRKLRLVHHHVHRAHLAVSSLSSPLTLAERAGAYFSRPDFSSSPLELCEAVWDMYELDELDISDCEYTRDALEAWMCHVRVVQRELEEEGEDEGEDADAERWEACKNRYCREMLAMEQGEGSPRELLDMEGMSREEGSLERHVWTEVFARMLNVIRSVVRDGWLDEDESEWEDDDESDDESGDESDDESDSESDSETGSESDTEDESEWEDDDENDDEHDGYLKGW